MTDRIFPCLWFDADAEEAVAFYTGLLPNSRVLQTLRNGDAVLTVDFELDGRRFLALNGGPHFKLTEAISIVIACETQAEIDRLWDGLLAGGGAPSQCGWLKDRFGLSWQVVPASLPRLLADPARAPRVMAALMQMIKLDLPTLEAA